MSRTVAIAVVLVGGLSFVGALAKTPRQVVPRDAALRAEKLPADLEPLRAIAQPKLPPGDGDWLDAHEEEGQSIGQHAEVCEPVPTRTLYLVPTGPMTPELERLVETLQPLLAAHFQLPVKALPALDATRAGRSAREGPLGTQWLTTDILELLLEQRPDDAAAVMAITSVDLYPDPAWNFVFGQASHDQRVGVTSLARLGDPLTEADLLLRRAYATSTHEIGHMLQLLHCIAWECPMNGSNHQDEADRQPLEPCPHCLAKLRRATGLDPKQRLRALRVEFERAGLTSGVKEIDRELSALGP